MLEKLRSEQDEIDKEIIAAIAKRLAVRKRISAFRQQNDLPTVDEARIKIVLEHAEDVAKEADVPADMAKSIFELLIDWSHRLDRQWRSESEK